MVEYGIRTHGGAIIVGPGWESVADVLGSAHGGYGSDTRQIGTLVKRADNSEWEEAS